MDEKGLRELLGAATPGPWKGNRTVIWRGGDPALDAAIARNDPKAGPIIASEYNHTGESRPSRVVGSTFGVPPVRGANAALIVAAVNALPALLDVAAAARETRGALGSFLVTRVRYASQTGGFVTTDEDMDAATLRLMEAGEALEAALRGLQDAG